MSKRGILVSGKILLQHLPSLSHHTGLLHVSPLLKLSKATPDAFNTSSLSPAVWYFMTTIHSGAAAIHIFLLYIIFIFFSVSKQIQLPARHLLNLIHCHSLLLLSNRNLPILFITPILPEESIDCSILHYI